MYKIQKKPQQCKNTINNNSTKLYVNYKLKEKRLTKRAGGLFLDAIYDFGRRGKMEPPGDSVTEWHCLHYTICVHTYLIFKKIKKFETIF